MEAVVAKAQDPGAADAAVLLTQVVAHLPGWDEKNFQVHGKALKQQSCKQGKKRWKRTVLQLCCITISCLLCPSLWLCCCLCLLLCP
jgi:hypothetical protein